MLARADYVEITNHMQFPRHCPPARWATVTSSSWSTLASERRAARRGARDSRRRAAPIDFLEAELQTAERVIAQDALLSVEMRRLMSVPGVNVITAATFLAAIGDISRLGSTRRLVGYLGLDPRVRQSGPGPAKHGRISKQGSAPARYALVEAAWSVVRQPGPLRAFYERIRARCGHQVAIVASARKLACLFWCLLTREPDYAYAQPSLTKKKLRRLELTAGAPKGKAKPGLWACQHRHAPGRARTRTPRRARIPPHRRRLAGQGQRRGRDTGTRFSRPSKRQAARQGTSPKPCALARRRPRHRDSRKEPPKSPAQLDFHPSRNAEVVISRRRNWRQARRI
jgi:transposase